MAAIFHYYIAIITIREQFDMKRFQNRIQDLFDNAKTIPFSGVPFKSEVRQLCEQNMCGCYGKSWTCPPAVESLGKLQLGLSKFDCVVIFLKVYHLEDSFDWEGMKSGIKDFQSRILKLKKSIEKTDPDFRFRVLGAGACSLCDACTYDRQLPCRNPEDALLSVEACGIDVMEMLQNNGLSYNNGKNTVTYVGALFSMHADAG